MNEHQRPLMDAPSIELPWCVFCGRRKQSDHHVVPRSQGGHKGPTVSVCGSGNEGGCHGRLHQHYLHLDWRDGAWWYLETDPPVKDHIALGMEGWRRLRPWG